MSVIESHGLLSRFTSAVETSATSDSSLASAPRDRRLAAWQGLVDHALIEYGRNASKPNEDDEFLRPTAASIERSIKETMALAKYLPVPQRVAPTGSGGLCFEWERGCVFFRVEFTANGEMEVSLFDGAKLLDHHIFD